MANIFIDGDKIANQKDIEAISSKTNTDTNLYELYVNDNPLKLTDVVNRTSNSMGRLKVIHQRVGNKGTETYGNYDSLLSFGGDDAIFAIDVSMFGAKAKILSPRWSEDIAWKSDIKALQNQINDLKKQIGGTK